MSGKFFLSGIICEFNPFHNGHALLLRKAREQGSTHLAVVMSGNFVQRGTAACLDKWARTRAALACGADLVIELPLPWAAARAETFAFGGVYLLHRMGCVRQLVFGSECGQTGPLQQLAAVLRSDAFPAVLRDQLRRSPGIPFPLARKQAVAQLCGETQAALLDSPNNILGVEYCKALQSLQSPILPQAILREGAPHHADGTPSLLPSSSQLRELLERSPQASLEPYCPAEAARVFSDEIRQGRAPARIKSLEPAILAHLRRMDPTDFSFLPDCTEGLEHRITDAVRQTASLEDLYARIKSKRYSHARIRRLILAAFLGIRAGDTILPPPYLRILGMNEKGRDILKTIAATPGSLPVVTKYAQIPSLSPAAQRLLALEAQADDLHALACPCPQPAGREWRQGIIFESSAYL